MSKILLFTSEKCAPCKAVKEYLNIHGVKYEEISTLGHHGDRMIAKYNVLTVPTLIYIGDSKVPHTIEGFNTKEYAKLIKGLTENAGKK